MDKFIYKTQSDVTTLSASLSKYTHKKHAHEEYSLGVILHGSQEYYVDGCSYSSNTKGVMLFNPEQPHNCKAEKRKHNLDYLMIYIRPELFLETIEKKDTVKFSSPITFEPKLSQDVINFSNAILNNNEETICNELFLTLMDNFTSDDLYKIHKNDSKFLAKVKEMIYYDINSVLKLDNMCKEFSMSKYQFIRAFKANTGISPYQYYLNIKVSLARKYIEKTRDIYATILKFGFVDLSHLNRHFKKVYGVTAYEYLSNID